MKLLKERIAQIESEFSRRSRTLRVLCLNAVMFPSGWTTPAFRKHLADYHQDWKNSPQCKKEDIKGKVSELSVNDMQMICGDEIMRDGKRLYSYGIDDGSVLDFIKLTAHHIL